MVLSSQAGDFIAIETLTATRDNLPRLLEVVQGCWKCSSILWLQANGFPVLPGLILNTWAKETDTVVSRFCEERHVSELLVRIEKPDQRWTRRRGGYTIPVAQVRRLVDELAAEGLFAILLEPASPYSDQFSLTCACDLETGKLDVEVVGTGFDASDILRGDIPPHERFEVSLEDRYRVALGVTRLHLVGKKEYEESVQHRLIKIGAKLRNPSYPDEVIGAATSDADRTALANQAKNFLKLMGQTALLDVARGYEPISEELLGLFLTDVRRLVQRMTGSEMTWRTFSLASSFLPAQRLVIWDFFVPGNHNTKHLWRF